MKSKFKHLVVLLSVALLLLSNSVTVFAQVIDQGGSLSGDVQTYIEENINGKGWNRISGYFNTDSSKGDASVTVVKDGTQTTYYYYKKDASKIHDKVESANSTTNSTEQLNDITGGLNIGADTETATEILGGITPAISILIGILVIGITLGMTIFTALDICYIVFPVLRNKMEDSKNSGGAMAKKNNDGSTSMRFITDEAQFAVQQVATDPGSNAMMTYFGKRVFSYIILAILLFLLLTGNITLITDLALKAVSGLLQVIQQIG